MPGPREGEVKERPILMSAPMVRATLEDSKTNTRRVMSPQPSHDQYHEWRGKVTRDAEHRMWCWKDLVLDNIWDFPEGEDRTELARHCPYGVPGDRLWVRETYLPDPIIDDSLASTEWYGCPSTRRLSDIPAKYRTRDLVIHKASWDGDDLRWMPSISMPRWASRITLEITDVRVQRLQEISEEDAEAEGVYSWSEMGPLDICARPLFASLWDSINAKRAPWASNPFIWALTFRRAK
jgi:hypothetical protein